MERESGDVWWDNDTWGGDCAWFVQMSDGTVQQFWEQQHAEAIGKIEREKSE